MKQILFYVCLTLSIPVSATIWQVEAGGGPGMGTPFFSPQNLTIEIGDVVNWNWVSGQHNVAAISGPESFNSGSHVSPFEWSYTFTISGTYNYECTLFDHADTQFGTIIVSPLSIANLEGSKSFDLMLYPNPAVNTVSIEKTRNGSSTVKFTDLSGRHILTIANSTEIRTTYDISDLPRGIYFVEVEMDGVIVRQRLLIQ